MWAEVEWEEYFRSRFDNRLDISGIQIQKEINEEITTAGRQRRHLRQTGEGKITGRIEEIFKMFIGKTWPLLSVKKQNINHHFVVDVFRLNGKQRPRFPDEHLENLLDSTSNLELSLFIKISGVAKPSGIEHSSDSN